MADTSAQRQARYREKYPTLQAIYQGTEQYKKLAKLKAAKFRKAHPERVNMWGANYRAIKAMAIPKWANQDKIAGFYETANGLGMLTGEWYHVDHIVPLKNQLVCGLHCEQNLQVIPKLQNISKGNRAWPDMPN